MNELEKEENKIKEEANKLSKESKKEIKKNYKIGIEYYEDIEKNETKSLQN